MKLAILLGLILTAFQVTPAQAALVHDREAGQIYQLLQSSRATAGTLGIRGYVTEKPNPPILFNTSFLQISKNNIVPLSSDSILLKQVVDVLVSVGVKEIISSGGTTYITYLAEVNCASATLCEVLPVQTSATDSQKTLIGRCAFQNMAMDPILGDFSAGNMLANFYAITDKQGNRKIVVAHGLSAADGYLVNKTDVVGGVSGVDQGLKWTTYEVTLSGTSVPFRASWIDNEARSANPAAPIRSEIGYDYAALNMVRSVPANGSYVQNRILGNGSVYPLCIFWQAP